MPFSFRIRCWIVLFGALAGSLQGSVVLNELLYHPPDDNDALQFIELHNTGPEPVALDGWRLTRGVAFTSPNWTLPAGGFAVICRNRAAFERQFGTGLPVIGEFKGRLKHGGERVELTDAGGRVVDALRYDDTPPWPVGSDGYGASLERIVADGPAGDPDNWAAAVNTDPQVLAATPGRTNTVASIHRPPRISPVTFEAPRPGVPVQVTAQVTPAAPGLRVELQYWVIASTTVPEPATVILEGGSVPGEFRGSIPAQPAGRLLRFRVRAVDARGAERWEPAPGEPRPTFSAFLQDNTNRLTVPEARLLTLGPRESPGPSLRHRSRGRDVTLLRGQSAFVVFPTNGTPAQTFDHIRLSPRSGGWKVRLHKDRPLDGMTTLNVVYEQRPRWMLSEPLAYEVFRRAGVPAPNTGHLRLWLNAQPLGYHLMFEQVNASFLRRHQLDPDGNLYKLLWYGNDVIGQHEKKNNPESGHADLLEAIALLDRGTGERIWGDIQRAFDVGEFASYFAVSHCIQNWDGFFNNYFVHRGPGPEGRWTIIPWDQDKTWGDHDGASRAYDWYDMPLTYGMKGDRRPGSRFSFFRVGNTGWDGGSWWRPGGYFSGPLLAHPQFRGRFLTRLHEMCQDVFTEPALLPVINDLERRLAPEVQYRASLEGMDPGQARAEFLELVDSFRRQLKHRRAFLIRALERESAGR